MVQTKIIVEDKSFSKIFSEKDTLLKVPTFQRPYCWTEKEIKEIFLDINSNERKFLGAVIFQKSTDIVGDETFEIIDGQQRISTLFWIVNIICFKALETAKEIKASLETGDGDNEHELDELENKLDPFIQEVTLGLFERRKKTYYSKLISSLNDIRQFNEAITKFIKPIAKHGNENAAPRKGYQGPEGERRGNLTSALLLIEEEIGSYIEKNCPEPTEEEIADSEQEDEYIFYWHSMLDKYLEMLNQIKGNLEFAVIKLSEEHDADEVFSKLNTAGISLNAQDLIKNQLFKLLEDDEMYHFWTDKWKIFEDSLIEGVKDELTTDEEQNAIKIDKYIKSFWHPYSLTINSNTGKKDQQVLNTVKSSWLEIEEDATLGQVEKAEKILNGISEYVPLYNCISRGLISKELERKVGKGVRKEDKPINIQFNRRIRNLSEYQPNSGSYPYLFDLLLYASKNKKNTSSVTTCLKYIESYHVRRNLYKDDSSVKNVFSNLWELSGRKPHTKLLNTKLHDSNRRWYEDQEIIDRSGTRNFYAMGKMADFILLTYERNLKGGDKWIDKDLQKEHVLPKTITMKKSDTQLLEDWEHFTLDSHEAVLNLWGNIVPVSERFNKTISNKGFDAKKREFNSAAYKSKTVHELFNNFTRWTEEEIHNRNKELYLWALSDNGWSKPSPPSKPSKNLLLKEIDKQKSFFNQQGIQKVYLYPHEGVDGKKRRIGAKQEFTDFLKDNNFFDYKSLDNSNNTANDAYFFSDLEEPLQIVIQHFTDKNGSPKFWLKHPTKPNFCGDEINNDSVVAFVLHNDKKLYVVDTSIKIIKDKAVKFFNT